VHGSEFRQPGPARQKHFSTRARPEPSRKFVGPARQKKLLTRTRLGPHKNILDPLLTAKITISILSQYFCVFDQYFKRIDYFLFPNG
jgi:hypothetical protein